MSKTEKIAVGAVSLMGSLGLGTGLVYLLGAYLMFRPGWPEWAEFFIRWGPPLVVVPFGLLIGHLYFRTRLGSWMLERGEPEAAIEYASGRLEHSLLRSRREALSHRVVVARGHVCQGEYRRAWEMLSRGYAVPQRGPLAVEIHRWRMEAALRQEAWEEAGRAFEDVELDGGGTGAKVEAARLWACRAELAAVRGEERGFESAIREARWLRERDWRVDLAEALGVARFSIEEEEFERAEGLVGDGFEAANVEVPGRRPELFGLRAELCWKADQRGRAREWFERAEAVADSGDERARGALERVGALVQQDH